MTPPSRKTKSSGEREKVGRRSNSSRATVPPATVRVVSMSVEAAALGAQGVGAGLKLKESVPPFFISHGRTLGARRDEPRPDLRAGHDRAALVRDDAGERNVVEVLRARRRRVTGEDESGVDENEKESGAEGVAVHLCFSRRARRTAWRCSRSARESPRA